MQEKEPTQGQDQIKRQDDEIYKMPDSRKDFDIEVSKRAVYDMRERGYSDVDPDTLKDLCKEACVAAIASGNLLTPFGGDIEFFVRIEATPQNDLVEPMYLLVALSRTFLRTFSVVAAWTEGYYLHKQLGITRPRTSHRAMLAKKAQLHGYQRPEVFYKPSSANTQPPGKDAQDHPPQATQDHPPQATNTQAEKAATTELLLEIDSLKAQLRKTRSELSDCKQNLILAHQALAEERAQAKAQQDLAEQQAKAPNPPQVSFICEQVEQSQEKAAQYLRKHRTERSKTLARLIRNAGIQVPLEKSDPPAGDAQVTLEQVALMTAGVLGFSGLLDDLDYALLYTMQGFVYDRPGSLGNIVKISHLTGPEHLNVFFNECLQQGYAPSQIRITKQVRPELRLDVKLH